MLRYDEPSLVEQLSQLPLASRVVFAAGCAERLRPLYQLYCDASGEVDLPPFDAALDAAWDAVTGGMAREAQHAWATLAEGLVPDEDDESWVDEYAYGQNGAAAVAYALRTALSGDPQEAAWGARQVYEAADFAARRRSPNLDLNEPGAEDELLSAPIVQEVLRGLLDDIGALQVGELDVEHTSAGARERARRAGLRLVHLV